MAKKDIETDYPSLLETKETLNETDTPNINKITANDINEIRGALKESFILSNLNKYEKVDFVKIDERGEGKYTEILNSGTHISLNVFNSNPDEEQDEMAKNSLFISSQGVFINNSLVLTENDFYPNDYLTKKETYSDTSETIMENTGQYSAITWRNPEDSTYNTLTVDKYGVSYNDKEIATIEETKALRKDNEALLARIEKLEELLNGNK